MSGIHQEAMLNAALRAYGLSSPRSLQSAAGIIGPSDLGFCRQKAVLMTRGEPQTDAKPITAAQMGTAIHAYVAEAVKAAYPDWIVDSEKVTATFPSGVEVSGTPDIIATTWNAVIDVKTVDGFAWVKREGVSQNHRYQRHAYALGAIQAGLLDPDKPVGVGNWYIDRSGKEQDGFLLMEEFDPTLTDEIDSWIGDVIYAVQHGEDAMQDIPAPVCERICDYYTACRGDLPVADGGEFIEDDGLKAAIRMFVDGRAMEKAGKDMKAEASALLAGVNGTDGEWTVRWTSVGESEVSAFTRPGYQRIDVRKSRGRA